MTLCLTFIHELSYIIYCHPQTTFHTPNTESTHQMKNIPTSQHFSIQSDAIFGGLGVVCWPLVPKSAGSNLAEAVGILGQKNPQHAFLRRGSKAVGPMS